MTSVPPCPPLGLEVGVGDLGPDAGDRHDLDDARPRRRPGCSPGRRWPRRSRTGPPGRRAPEARPDSCDQLEAAGLRGPGRRRTPARSPTTACAGRPPRSPRPPRRRARSGSPSVQSSGGVPAGALGQVSSPAVVPAVDAAELAVEALRRPLGEHVLGADRGAGDVAAALEGAGADEGGGASPLPRVDELLGRRRRPAGAGSQRRRRPW